MHRKAVLCPIIQQSALPEAAFWDMSDVHESPVCIQLSLLPVKQRVPGYKVSYALVVIVSTDLTTYFLRHFKYQWVHNTCEYCTYLFPRHFAASHTLTNHPYVITCGAGENYLKWHAIQLASHQREYHLYN